MRPSSLIVLGMLAVACTPNTPAAPAPLSATELDAVKAVDAAFAAGINAKDTTAVFAVYATDAKLMPPDSPALTGAAVHSLIASLIAGGASDMVLTSTTAYGVGDLAYLVGTANYKMGGAAEPVKYTEVLRKNANGKWQYVVDMFSGVAAPVPAVAPAKKK